MFRHPSRYIASASAGACPSSGGPVRKKYQSPARLRLRSVSAVEVDSPLQSFPLSGLAAERMAEGPVVLVGEAAHAFPPIGAQGLNLGLRDVATLVREPLRLDTRRAVEDAAARYDRARRIDVKSRTAAVDALNRSLLSAFLPVQFARAAGISLLSMPGPLRDMALREGMKPGSSLTSLPGRLREKFRRRSAADQHQEDERHRHH